MFAVKPADLKYTIYGRVPRQVSPPRHPWPPCKALPQPQLNNVLPPGPLSLALPSVRTQKRFAHDDYKNLENINFFELPLRIGGGGL